MAVVALSLAVASAGTVGDEGRALARTVGDAGGLLGRDGQAARSGENAPRGGAPGETRDDADDAGDDIRGGTGGAGADAREGDEKAPAPTGSPRLLGLGVATAARCGPQLSSPDGVEAQTCVLSQGADTWARTYYRNATGEDVTTVLSLLEPDGRTVRIDCEVGAEDDPGVCETPRERAAGDLGAYTAIAEFARGARGPLLLRSGSNSTEPEGS
ncbi:hypothetical protein OK074_7326 [Actinobacteria bacterium OK074]|nr:hypothetical protein OK074_7326 [Actinobacteria bacterium OK074]